MVRIMKNNKGFTLIEIIVTLLITSIALIMSATFILNTMGFFSDESSTSLRKQSVDGISQYIYNQLIYATEVKIQINKPEGNDWQWLSVKKEDNLNLLQHNDDDVYNDSYYLGEEMDIIVKGYDKYRLDVKVSFTGTNNKSYSSKTTLELLNLKYEFEKKQSSKIAQIDTKEYNLSGDENAYKIYYRNSNMNYEKNIEKDDSITPNEEIDTVEDEIKCKDDKESTDENPTNDKGEFKLGNKYNIGDFVYVISNGNKQWYRAIKSFNSEHGAMYKPTDSVRGYWKKISDDYGNMNMYFYGDVVRYNGQYYQVIKKSGTWGISGKKPGESDYWSEGFSTVEELRKSTNIFSSCTMGGQVDDDKNDNEDVTTKITGTVADKLINVDQAKIDSFNNNKFHHRVDRKPDGTYKEHEFVKVDGIVYLCVSGYNPGAGEGKKPGDPALKQHWQKVQEMWDENSAYLAGDVVKYKNGKYYRCTYDVNVHEIDIINPIITSWEEVKRNNSNDAWILVCKERCE